MSILRNTLGYFVVTSLIFLVFLGNVQAFSAEKKALVLYDEPAGAAYTKLGKAYSIMLYNLLGHFETDINMLAVRDYEAGTIEKYDITFYLGSYYDNQLPNHLLNELFETEKTIVWFKYNIWQLASSTAFADKYGFTYSQLRSLNETPTPSNPSPGFFNRVMYKGKGFDKYYQYNPDTNTVAVDPDIAQMTIVDSNKAQSKVDIKNVKTSETAPYIVNSNNFWYIADVPFSFIGPRDRYLVFCDVLHDILKEPHQEKHYAMIRLEDVSAYTEIDHINQIGEYLYSKNIPFTVAAVPIYRDPFGTYNGGVPDEKRLSEYENFRNVLYRAYYWWGDIIQHGTTHQYESLLNPHSAITADDFEFWNIVANTPVSQDSVEWAKERILEGKKEFTAVGIKPYAFETPHYQGSPNSYQAVGSHYNTRYGRAVYYTSDNPQLNLPASDPNRDFSVGQFFPYIIHKDYYGHRVLPENLGNIEYDISDTDPSSNIEYGWEELLLNAEYALTIRDGYASFFFHPFWLSSSLGKPGFADLKKLVDGINNLNYQWTNGRELLLELGD